MKSVFYQVRMPDDLRKLLKKKAEAMGMSLNALILQALWTLVKAG